MDESLRQLVWERAGGVCEYCRIPSALHPLPFQIDHIVAEKHHGLTVPANLALSCYWCTVHKGPNIAGIDPESEQIVPLYHPRNDQWHDHFRYAGPLLLGLTPSGRATVDVLGINHPVRVAVRHALITEGMFPPTAKHEGH
jgi:hypothetical protein